MSSISEVDNGNATDGDDFEKIEPGGTDFPEKSLDNEPTKPDIDLTVVKESPKAEENSSLGMITNAKEDEEPAIKTAAAAPLVKKVDTEEETYFGKGNGGEDEEKPAAAKEERNPDDNSVDGFDNAKKLATKKPLAMPAPKRKLVGKEETTGSKRYQVFLLVSLFFNFLFISAPACEMGGPTDEEILKWDKVVHQGGGTFSHRMGKVYSKGGTFFPRGFSPPKQTVFDPIWGTFHPNHRTLVLDRGRTEGVFSKGGTPSKNAIFLEGGPSAHKNHTPTSRNVDKMDYIPR